MDMMANYEGLATELLQVNEDLLRVPARHLISKLTQGEHFVLNYLLTHRHQAHPVDLSRGLVVSTARIAALLNRMEDKGLVTVEVRGRTKYYAPALEREQAVRRETRSFLNKVYRGSVGLMVSAMAQDKALTRKEIDELYEILRQAEEGAK